MPENTETIDQEVKDEVQDQPTEPTPAPEPKVEDTTTILKDIRDKLSEPKPGEKQLNPQEIRDQIKEQTGLTDAQLDYLERDKQASIAQAVAPLQEKVAWSELKDEVGGIEPEVRKLMDDELKVYDPFRRGDPVLIKKIYYMALGQIHGRKSRETPIIKDDRMNDNVVTRRIVSQNPGSTVSLSSGGGSKNIKMTDEERAVARKYNMTDEEWAKSKATTEIKSFKK